jgi:transposase-like protein
MAQDTEGLVSNGLRGTPRLEPKPGKLRGALTITDTMRSAARQVREGAHRRDVATLYGVSISQLAQWITRVNEEREDGL